MGDKIAYHPNGIHVIEFREEPHTYTDNFGQRYLSGTSLVKPFFPKFDSAFQAVKCSKGKNPRYVGRTPKEILAEWEAERFRGSSEGDNAHLYGEALTADWPMEERPGPISLRCAFLFWQIRRAVRWLTQTKGFVFISAELIVFSPALGIAGMIDLLMWDPATNMMWILDWKQNKMITTQNEWQTGFGPISHLQQTDINTYTLQLSTYQYLLQKEIYFSEIKTYKRALIHLMVNDFKFYPLEYYDYEVEEMLKTVKEK